MEYKALILVLFFYFLTLFQNSFLSHFSIYGVVPNFVLILVCLLGFFSVQGGPASGGGKPHEYFGLFLVLIAGFFLDIFSRLFLGASIFSLIIIYFFIKKTIHILRDIPRKYSIIYFIPIFILSIILYDFLLGFFYYFSNQSEFLFPRVSILLIKITYNLIFAVIGFYLVHKYDAQRIQSK